MSLLQMRRDHHDEMLEAARGDIPVDTLIHGGRILNVMTGEILDGDIAIHKGFIVSLFARDIQATRRIDATGRIVLPAFIVYDDHHLPGLNVGNCFFNGIKHDIPIRPRTLP